MQVRLRPLIGILAVLAVLSGGTPALAGNHVFDDAQMFSAATVDELNQRIDRIGGAYKKEVFIATVPGMKGRTPDAIAAHYTAGRTLNGIFILIAKAERKTLLNVGNSTSLLFTRDRQQALNSAINSQFKAGKFDAGILAGVGYIEDTFRAGMASAIASSPKAKPSVPKPAPKTAPTRTLSAFVGPNGMMRLHFLDNLKGGSHAGEDNLSLSFPAGLAVFNTNHAIDVKDLQASAFLQVTPASFLALANLDGSSRSLGDAPFDVNFTIVRDGERALVKGHGTLNAPLSQNDVGLESAVLSGTSSGSLKQGDSAVHLRMSGEVIARKFPIESLHVKFTESDAETSLSASITVATASIGEQVKETLQDTKQLETQIRQFLAQGGFDVVTVEFKRLETSPDLTGYEALITVKDFRRTMQSLGRSVVDQAGRMKTSRNQKIDYEALNHAVGTMLNFNIDAFEIEAQRTGSTLDAKVTSRVTNLDQFLSGYLELYGQLAKVLETRHPYGRALAASSADVLFLRVAARQFQILGQVLQQPSAVTDHNDVRYEVTLTSQNERSTVEATLDANVEVKGLLQAARERGLPTIDRDDLLLTLKSSAGRILGHFRLSESGNWMEPTRKIYADVAEQIPEFKALAPILRSLTLTDLRASARLKDGRLEGTAFARTSPLTDLSRWIVARVAPGFGGTVTDVRISDRTAEGAHSTSSGDLFVSNWTGATQAQISKVLADLTHRAVIVKMGVDPASLKAPDLVAPTVEVPEDLRDDSKPAAP